jgi:hypothetical protein
MSQALFISDPEHWIKRACEMRQLALLVEDSDARAAMLRLAHEYERLADRCHKRAIGSAEQRGGQPDQDVT